MGILTQIWNWLSLNYQFAISLLIQIVIAYHVYFLSIRLSNKDKLLHKEEVLRKCDILFKEINTYGKSIEVFLVNIKRYYKDYPSNERNVYGDTYIKTELKSAKFDGLEFFDGNPFDVFQKEDGSFSKKGINNHKPFKAFPVGLLPYEWIEHIELDGDEYSGVPLIFCHYKGKGNWKYDPMTVFFKGYPFKRIFYYLGNEQFYEGKDPFFMKYIKIDKEISDD